MTRAENFMSGFMSKLSNNEYQKDNRPNKGPVINDEFVKAQLVSYEKVLESKYSNVMDKSAAL